MNMIQYLLVVLALASLIAIPLLPVRNSEAPSPEKYIAMTAFEPSCWDSSYAPEAAFDFTVIDRNPYYYASFDARASRAGTGAIVTYTWDFGDGTTGSGVRVAHTYHEAYDIVRFATLTVTNARGCTDRSVEAIDLRKPLPALSLGVTMITVLPRVPEWLPSLCYVGAILALLGVLLLG
jgi:hypothetical protein